MHVWRSGVSGRHAAFYCAKYTYTQSTKDNIFWVPVFEVIG